MSTVVSVSVARSRLGELVTRAANGEEVMIMRRGQPVVALKALHTKIPEARRRQAGSEAPSQLAARLSEQLGSRFRLDPARQERLEALAKKSKHDALAPEEDKELGELLAEYDRMALLRARAMCEME